MGNDMEREACDCWMSGTESMQHCKTCNPDVVPTPAQPVEASQDEVERKAFERQHFAGLVHVEDTSGYEMAVLKHVRFAFDAGLKVARTMNNPASLSPSVPDRDGDAQIAPRTDVVNPSDAKDGGEYSNLVIGQRLLGIEHVLNVPSARVLSAIPPRNSLRELVEAAEAAKSLLGNAVASTIPEGGMRTTIHPTRAKQVYKQLLAALDAQTQMDKKVSMDEISLTTPMRERK